MTNCIEDVDALALCAVNGEDGCSPPDIIKQQWNWCGLVVVVALAEESREWLF